ncbi:MAG: TetR/AcrR family transcriptional regulator [Caulobacterales bacterium]
MPTAKSAATRARILEAARFLLEEKSSQEISLHDIATVAKSKPPLIVRYFRSKDSLIFQAIVFNLNTRGKEDLERHRSNGDLATYAALVHHLMQLDLGNNWRTRDLLSMMHRWTCEEEAAFAEAVSPRTTLARALIAQEAENRISPHMLDEVVALSTLVYAEELRLAMIRGTQPHEAAEAVIARTHRLVTALSRFNDQHTPAQRSDDRKQRS